MREFEGCFVVFIGTVFAVAVCAYACGLLGAP